jgi:hypothetical protein
MTLISSTPNAPAAQPDLSALPLRVDRRTAAALVSRHYFPTSFRALEAWPLDWRILNGRATCATAELFALAESKLAAAQPSRRRRQAA